jgi:hypothetical protein
MPCSIICFFVSLLSELPNSDDFHGVQNRFNQVHSGSRTSIDALQGSVFVPSSYQMTTGDMFVESDHFTVSPPTRTDSVLFTSHAGAWATSHVIVDRRQMHECGAMTHELLVEAKQQALSEQQVETVAGALRPLRTRANHDNSCI